METLRNIFETVKGHPYICFLLGFGAVVAYGVVRLLALVQTLQG
jgi:hypothetical protein